MRKATPLPPVEELLDRFDYDPNTGELRYMRDVGPVKAGYVCGHKSKAGYFRVKINSVLHFAHRVIWKMVYGDDPDNEIDHANGDRADNRLCNLRTATRGENMMNRKRFKNNISGIVGVHLRKDKNNWVSKININKKQIYLGYFPTKEEAIEARRRAELELFGQFSSLNRPAPPTTTIENLSVEGVNHPVAA